MQFYQKCQSVLVRLEIFDGIVLALPFYNYYGHIYILYNI